MCWSPPHPAWRAGRSAVHSGAGRAGRPAAQRGGEPVGRDPVSESGQEGVAGVDAGQDQQAAEAGLHDAEPARGEREEGEDLGGGVGQQHQGGPRVGSGGAQSRQQTAVVEAEAAGGQQHRLPPLLVQHGPDRVTFGQQPLVQAGERRPVPVGDPVPPADDPVPQALRRAPECRQWPLRAQHDHAKYRVQDKPGDTEQGGTDEPGTGRRAGQDDGQHEQGQRQQSADAEQPERGQPADGRVGVEPRGGEHAELDGGACRVAARQAVGDRVAGQPGGDHGEPALGAQGQPLQCEVAGERGQFGDEREREPGRVQRRQARKSTQHRDEAGQYQVDGRARHRDDQGPLDEGFPGQRVCLRGVDRGGLRRDRSGRPGPGRPLAGVLRMSAGRHGVVHPR